MTELSTSIVDEDVHKEMMKTVLNEFRKQGFTNIKANVENMTTPEKVDDHTPDLTCNRNDKQQEFIILEVETCNTITLEQSKEKWRAFYRKSKDMKGEFHLAVPKFCNGSSGRTLANQRLEQLQLKANCVWAVNGDLQHIAMRAKARKSD